jgi:hypothetical protein
VNARRTRAIARKDLRDAWRDGRIATMLVVPVLGGWTAAKLNGEAPAGADAAAAIGPLFDTGAFSWLVILAWALVGHALLVRVATRREL